MATIGSLVFKIGADTAEILDGVNKVNAKLGTMPQELDRVQSRTAAWGSFVGNVMADVAAKVGHMAVDAIGDLITRSEKMSAVGTSFGSLTRTVGEMGDKFLEVSRTAAKGLISDFDLMQAANKGILLGLPITSSSFSQLAQTAIVLGRAMGQGPNQSLNDLITALGRSSPLILDNLGLSVKVGEANEKYAKALGKTSEQLSDGEKKMAFYNAAMTAASQKVAELGGIQDRSVDIITRVKVAWDNLLDRTAAAIAKSPVLQQALSGISDVLTGYIAKLDQSATVGGKVDAAVLMMLRSFNGLLSGLDFVQGAFNAFQSGLAGIFAGMAQNAVTSLAPMKELFFQLSKMPGSVGDSAQVGFAAVSAAMSAASHIAVGYNQVQKEQEQDFVRNSQAIGNLQSKLGALIDSLQGAKMVMTEHAGVTRVNTEETEKFSKSIFDAVGKVGNGFGTIKNHMERIDIAGTMGKSAEAAERLAEANRKRLEPSFFVVGRAAEDAAKKVEMTTRAAMQMSAMLGGGLDWTTSFTRGTLLSPGSGFTLSVAQQMMANPAQWGFTGTGAGYWHSGGAVGWAGAKRFHNGGLMDGEYPAVLQTGEGVLSRRGMDTLGKLNAGTTSGGSTVCYVTVDARGSFFDTPEAMERLGAIASRALADRLKRQGVRV